MDRIDELAEGVREELDDAGKYAEKARARRETDAEEAAIYGRMAEEELQHAANLCRMGQMEADRSGDAAAKRIWDWEARRMRAAEKRVRETLEG